MRRPIGWLLRYANAHASRDIYALKDRLLPRYGQRVGEDVQRITDECWGDGENGCDGATCRRCRGTGVFRTRLVLLERWNLGGYTFHRPDRTVFGNEWTPTIEGRIRHDDVSRIASSEAQLWLALFFDRVLFAKLLSRSRYCGWQWRPMLVLQIACFEARQLALRFAPRQCHCGASWLPMWEQGHWFVCRSCRTHPVFERDNDLPF